MSPTRLPTPKPGRLPGLDGLRGLAILVVMACHFVRDGADHVVDRTFALVARQGTIGVDLFFVLSGFLITGILLDARGAPRFFRNFYGRRVLRLLPLYYLAVAALALGGFLHGIGGWYWTHTVNWLIASRGDFEAAPAWSSVFWSLSVEEQFYLAWPVVVALAGPRRLGPVCAALGVGSLAVRLVLALTGAPWPAIYTSTLTRLEPLVLGAWIALLARRPGGLAAWRGVARVATPIAGLAAAVLAFAPLPLPDNVAPSLGFTAASFLSGGVIVLSQTAPVRWLEHRALRTLGTYSYGIYVIHTAIAWAGWHLGPELSELPTVGGSQLPGQLAYVVVEGAFATGAAWVLFHGFEKHFLALKRWLPLEARPSAPEATLTAG